MNAPFSIRHSALDPRPRGLCALVADYSGRLPVPDGVIIEEKIDGIRCLYVDGDLMTRNGDPIDGAEHIRGALQALEREAGAQMFFDGEFQVDGTLDATRRHFAMRGRNGDRGTLWLFDVLPLADWRSDLSDMPCTARRAMLDRLPVDGATVRVLPWDWVDSADVAEGVASELISGGAEGVLIKNPSSAYRRRRSDNWQRITASQL